MAGWDGKKIGRYHRVSTQHSLNKTYISLKNFLSQLQKVMNAPIGKMEIEHNISSIYR